MQPTSPMMVAWFQDFVMQILVLVIVDDLLPIVVQESRLAMSILIVKIYT